MSSIRMSGDGVSQNERSSNDGSVVVAHAEPANLQAALQDLVQTWLGEPLAADSDVQARLQDNAQVLTAAGLDTPEKVLQWLGACRAHDLGLAALGLGVCGNIGYIAGMTIANEKLIPLLPSSLLADKPLLGFVVGFGVAALDVMCAVFGSAYFKPRLYNGAEAGALLPASITTLSKQSLAARKATFAAVVNLLKNAARLPAPLIQARVEGRSDGTISRLWSDRIDITGLDGGLGFGSSAAFQCLQIFHPAVNGLPPYGPRLLLRSDLEAVIEQSRGNTHSAPGLLSALGATGRACTTSLVPLYVVTTVGLFIALLFTANDGIDDALTARAGKTNPALDDPTRADPLMVMAKRASTQVLMAAMSATIEAGAPYADQAAQALKRQVTRMLQSTLEGLPDVGALMHGLLAAGGSEPEPSQGH